MLIGRAIIAPAIIIPSEAIGSKLDLFAQTCLS
jgi:hypothetical protein